MGTPQVPLLPPWYDVDTIEDLERLHRELMSAQNGAAVWTRKYLEGRRDHPSPE